MPLLVSAKQLHPHAMMHTEPHSLASGISDSHPGKQAKSQTNGFQNGFSSHADKHDDKEVLKAQSDEQIWAKAHAHLIDTGVPWTPILVRKAKGCLLYVNVTYISALLKDRQANLEMYIGCQG